jgi:tight adherence protein B
MTFPSPTLALVLLAIALLLAVVALRILVTAWVARGAVLERSSLEVAERRAGRLRARLNRRLLRTGFGDAVEVRLSSAGVKMLEIDFLFICAVAFVLATLLARVMAPLWLAALVGVLAVRMCLAWVDRQREKRKLAFVAQLPEVARVLSNASAAGLAIRSGIELAAGELDDPARTELRRVAEELALGQSVERALANLERRMPSRDVGVLISTLVIQQRSGGDLVRALQDMADALDNRRDLAREIRTVMAGSVFTGYMVALIGVATLLLMNVINSSTIDRLTSSFLGVATLVVAVALYAAGFLLIRKVTSIEV